MRFMFGRPSRSAAWLRAFTMMVSEMTDTSSSFGEELLVSGSPINTYHRGPFLLDSFEASSYITFIKQSN
ncbi:hypothetical protein ATANTOWER_025393 [Ataeniobius toweri]|uniref:Uncharacterized protein n=1 Tax=Ataeniobius toweri TaxID=208326 RepID=A0ABU7A9I6_9TELE|nr:hypothetical protein [Ataeniobius toweri]